MTPQQETATQDFRPQSHYPAERFETLKKKGLSVD